MLEIGATQSAISYNRAANAQFRSDLAECCAISFEPSWRDNMIEQIMLLCNTSDFAEEQIRGVGQRTYEQSDRAGRLIRFLLERRALFDWAQSLIDCEPLHHVTGLIGRIVQGSGQGLGWHDDQNDGGNRRLAVTIHLGDAPYDGGVFEIKRKDRPEILFSQGYQPPGTMTIFRIGRDLHHRVCPVDAGGPRTVFAGWISV